MADRCTIIRRGEKIDTVEVKEVTESDLADMMVGRSVGLKVDKKDQEHGEAVLEIQNLVVRDQRNVDMVKRT